MIDGERIYEGQSWLVKEIVSLCLLYPTGGLHPSTLL